MERLEHQRVLIAGRIVTRHVYIPDVRCGGLYIKYSRQWHAVGEVAHARYSYYVSRTLDVLEGALIDEQVDEAFHRDPQPGVK